MRLVRKYELFTRSPSFPFFLLGLVVVSRFRLGILLSRVPQRFHPRARAFFPLQAGDSTVFLSSSRMLGALAKILCLQ